MRDGRSTRSRPGPPARGVAATVERQDVAWRHRPDDLSAFTRGAGPGAVVRDASQRLSDRLAQVGVVGGLQIAERKPDWLRARRSTTAPRSCALKQTVRDLDLVTVCEEAGCPNMSECWADGTATFMVCGERCTRACGFCLVDTRQPARRSTTPSRSGSPRRSTGWACDHAVLTMVARDDLADGGARAGRGDGRGHPPPRRPAHDGRGADPRLQGRRRRRSTSSSPPGPTSSTTTSRRWPACSGRCARRPATPAAWRVLARAKAAGLTTKSGLIVGMGETDAEVVGALADLAGVGVDIVTIGQYLRPTTHHLPVARWVPPEAFDRLQGGRRGARHRPRRGQPADPLELPRQAGRGARRHDGRAAGPGRRPQLRLTRRRLRCAVGRAGDGSAAPAFMSANRALGGRQRGHERGGRAGPGLSGAVVASRGDRTAAFGAGGAAGAGARRGRGRAGRGRGHGDDGRDRGRGRHRPAHAVPLLPDP